MPRTLSALFLILCASLSIVAAEEAADPAALVREVLAEVPLVDGHNDAPWAMRSRFDRRVDSFDFHDTASIDKPMHTDIDRLRRGGVGAQFWSVWIPSSMEGGEAVVTVIEQIDLVHRLVKAYPEDLELALTAADIRRIHKDGRIASLIGMEGGHSIGGSIAVLRQLYALGARYMTLTHWDNNEWADAATDEPEHDGLSPFGEAVVLEMNRLGMMVDLAHVSAAAMNDVLDISRAPVIFSHSNAFEINPHPRNVPDDVLRRVGDTGGVVMVNFGSFFISYSHVQRWAAVKAERARLETIHPGDPDLVKQTLEAWYEANPVAEVSLGDLADHIDHIREVAGIDHVGLGSDFDGIGALPEGLEDVSGYPALLEELARRGYSKADLAKVAGLNLLRVMEEAEKAAEELADEVPSEARLASDGDNGVGHHD